MEQEVISVRDAPLRKGRNLPSAKRKYLDSEGSLALIKPLVFEKKISEFKLVEICVVIDSVLRSAHGGGGYININNIVLRIGGKITVN